MGCICGADNRRVEERMEVHYWGVGGPASGGG